MKLSLQEMQQDYSSSKQILAWGLQFAINVQIDLAINSSWLAIIKIKMFNYGATVTCYLYIHQNS